MLIVCDADNTLWDLDAVFVTAQLGLLSSIEDATGTACHAADKLEFVRRLANSIAEYHPDGPRYPKWILATKIAEVLSGGEALSKRDAIGHAERFESEVYTAVPALRVGVLAGIRTLKDANFTIVVATEGPQARCRSLLDRFGLAQHITACEEVMKSPEVFRTLRLRFAATERDLAFSVGDSERDIIPAKAAGFSTVLVVSRITPVARLRYEAEFTASEFDGAVCFIMRTLAEKNDRAAVSIPIIDGDRSCHHA